ncbi:MAG: transcriptional repressor [Lachnospiraceae bacterium]|nr:transcriptional repressor [Lachnospiraceae bacterium]
MVTNMQKDLIVQKMRDSGCRITRQRLMLLDIILEEDCSSCKEIFYKASRQDKRIGTATVYRMINTLEEVGAISRRNMYRIACGKDCSDENACTVELEDSTVIELSAGKWNQVIQAGLEVCGYINDQKVRNVMARSCVCAD